MVGAFCLATVAAVAVLRVSHPGNNMRLHSAICPYCWKVNLFWAGFERCKCRHFKGISFGRGLIANFIAEAATVVMKPYAGEPSDLWEITYGG